LGVEPLSKGAIMRRVVRCVGVSTARTTVALGVLVYLVAFDCLVLLAILPGSATAQKSSDTHYVEFCLKHMSPEMRHEVEGMRCVLNPFELDELLALPTDDEREQWIDQYWSLRDPIFTTPENEIRMEHARRVAHAESVFFIPKSPMWDQRGEVYIRYGPPTYRGLIAPEVDHKRATPRGELWYYSDYDMTVLFEDAFSRGEYTYYREKVRGPSGVRTTRIEDPIDAEPRHVPHPDDPVFRIPLIAMEAEYNQQMERIGRFYEMLKKTPSVYSYDLQRKQEPFVFSVDHFRGGEWIDRVDVNIEFEADLRPRLGIDTTRTYVATAVFWDTARKEVGRRQRSVRLAALDSTSAAVSAQLIPVQLVFSLAPGFYHMAITVEDRTLSRIASRRADVTCEDFESKLAVSDILFAALIEATERVSPFSRGAWVVVPHPLHRYRRFESIPVYFEVYNLGVGDNGASTYTVEYQVVKREPGGPGGRSTSRTLSPEISSSFSQSTYGSMDVVHIALKSDNFREGVFDLRVRITDEITHAAISREASFSVVE
jgi:GWxTD domain-containing protein